MQTSLPADVHRDMKELLNWYENADKNLDTLALLHTRYEKIHPFQDGNGRTGRLILYREALKHDIIPPIIHDANRMEYIEGIREYAEKGVSERMCILLKKEQEEYEKTINFFLG